MWMRKVCIMGVFITAAKNRRKSLAAFALAGAVVIAGTFPSGPVYAASDGAERGAVAEKEEVVYAVLSPGGAPESAYVVNRFRPSAPGAFTDYGDYAKATALSSATPVEVDGDAVTFEFGDAPFSYQGDVREPVLPWTVDIGYRLDGEEISAESLAGADGALEIQIRTSRNPGADKTYYENYLLQISVTLDGDRCSNVNAPDASVASAGSDKTAAFTSLPGEDADYTLSADVTDFEMGGIQFAALPFTMAFELPDADEMTGDMDELVDAVDSLNDGTEELSDGASELAGGVAKLDDGAGDIGEGAGKLAGGSSGFAKGLNRLDKGSADLVGASSAIGDGLKQLDDSMAPLAGGMDLSGLFAMVPGFDQTPTGAAVIAQVDALNKGLSGISEGLGDLSKNYASFHRGLAAYTDGVGELSDNYGKLDKSLSALSGGISEMADGTSELNKGTSKLAEGVSSLHDGTSELYDGVSDMPEKVAEKIDEFAEKYDRSGYEPKSFASPKNRDVSLVQFVFRTEAIEKPDETKAAEEQPEKTSFIDRLLALFG
jgi:X-X-X-Leu-X-X-Gly heptad repeat protein